MALLETIGNLRAWQVAVIIAVWVLGIAGAFGVYQFTARTDDNGGDTLGEDQQLYSVATGDLVNEVSVSGGLVFPNREALDFGVQGTVGRVLVAEGDFVTEGQTLAVLDEESIANLEKDIAQAELDLRDAREALDKALAPYTALDLARAESDVANADADLKSRKDDLVRNACAFRTRRRTGRGQGGLRKGRGIGRGGSARIGEGAAFQPRARERPV